ncbi:MAG TPA: class II aldolase/adducin family protein [Burkholderiales bacterium]
MKIFLAGLLLFSAQAWPQPDARLVEDLVAANRILAHEGILAEGWGHVSVRLSRDRFLISTAVAPEMVQASDLVEIGLDGNPVDGKARDLYSERFIHAEVYRVRPDVMSVVHTHAPPVVPFANSKVPLRPMYARSAFIGLGVPVFDIREAAGMTDLLIRTPAIGAALAKVLADKPAVLMRGHGATVVGPSIQRAVSRSIFLAMNASLQQNAIALGGPITYLDPEEVRLVEAREGHGLKRAWEAWKRRAMEKK